MDRQFILGDEEKRMFHHIMRQAEAFLEVRVVTYCLMSNHFHVLLDVPDQEEVADRVNSWSDDDLLAHLSLLYSEEHVGQVRCELPRLRVDGLDEAAERIRQSYLSRIGSMAQFMKSLKQRFSSWYNRLNGRRGTLWEERYKSVLVEGSRDALSTMAAYIDLNPVRAGIVKDPKDYRWCGYGEACGGVGHARRRLEILLEFGGEKLGDGGKDSQWAKVGAAYRLVLFGIGEERRGIRADGGDIRRGFSREEAIRIWKAGGSLSRSEALRCRIRYFSDGLAIGGKRFLHSVFIDEARPGPAMRGLELGQLRTGRDLREKPVS